VETSSRKSYYSVGVIAVGLLAVVAIGFWDRSSNVRSRDELRKTSLPLSERSLIKSTAAPENRARASVEVLHLNNPEYVATHSSTDGRAQLGISLIHEDPEYKKRVDHHLVIKAHSQSTRKDSPEYQDVLKSLLSHGYGIDVMQQTFNALLKLSFQEQTLLQQLRNQGTLENVDEIIKSEMENRLKFAKKRLQRNAGIYDERTINDLLNKRIPDLGESLQLESLVPVSDGEMLLNDGEWLNAEYRDAQALYTGPTRPNMTFQEKIDAWSKYRIQQLHSER